MITNLRKKLGNKSKKSGFTLIELIIVIAIIAILVMIALPKFAEVKENANVKADVASAKEIQTAVLALINDDKITTYNVTNQEVKAGADDPGKVAAYMQNGAPKGKSKSGKGANFTYDISDIGDVTVYLGGHEAYPNNDLE